MDLYARNRAMRLAMARHFNQHQHCQGFDRNRYHPDYDYRCPHGEGNPTPPLPSRWDTLARKAAADQHASETSV